MKYHSTLHPLTKGGEFTEAEATINRNSVQPTIYIPIGKPTKDSMWKTFSCREKDRSKLIDANIIIRNTNGGGQNKAWGSDGNPRKEEIRRSMIAGFQLTHQPWQVLHLPDGYHLIDRRTTDAVVVGEYEYKKIFANIYYPEIDPKTGEEYTLDEIRNELSQFGTVANTYEDIVRGKPTMTDIANEIKNAWNKGWLTNVDDRGVPDWQSVYDRVKKICGPNSIGEKKQTEIATRVVNHAEFDVTGEQTTQIISKAADAETWMTSEGRNFIDVAPVYEQTSTLRKKLKKHGIKYVLVMYDKSDKIGVAAKLYSRNPDYEYRIIIVPGHLTGYDNLATYWNRIKKFTSDFYNDLEVVSKTYFGGMTHNLDRVYIYGAPPSVKVAVDDNLDGEPQVLNKMIFYKKSSDTWVQK